MKVGLFSQTFHQYTPLAEKAWKIGHNTGNLLFLSALYDMVDCELVPHDSDQIGRFDAIITTDLIWLREQDGPNEQMLRWLTYPTRIVPISVGLQAAGFDPSFRLQPAMVNYLAALQERSVLAVRGEYTAEILAKHGIKNTQVIGCPSLYQLPLYQDDLGFLTREMDPDAVAGNHKTLYGRLSEQEINLLRFMCENGCDFIEQTLQPLANTNVDDPVLLSWMNRRSHIFFDQESWLRHMTRYSFSVGARFHGNVAALLAGAPSLFIIIDSRMREMTELFRLPRIALPSFQHSKPMAHYRELADYREFQKAYPVLLDRFMSFLRSNDLPLRPRVADRAALFTQQRRPALLAG